jgi:hypothetical protein
MKRSTVNPIGLFVGNHRFSVVIRREELIEIWVSAVSRIQCVVEKDVWLKKLPSGKHFESKHNSIEHGNYFFHGAIVA